MAIIDLNIITNGYTILSLYTTQIIKLFEDFEDFMLYWIAFWATT